MKKKKKKKVYSIGYSRWCEVSTCQFSLFHRPIKNVHSDAIIKSARATTWIVNGICEQIVYEGFVIHGKQSCSAHSIFVRFRSLTNQQPIYSISIQYCSSVSIIICWMARARFHYFMKFFNSILWAAWSIAALHIGHEPNNERRSFGVGRSPVPNKPETKP